MTIAWCLCDAAGSGGGPTGPMPISIRRWPIWASQVRKNSSHTPPAATSAHRCSSTPHCGSGALRGWRCTWTRVSISLTAAIEGAPESAGLCPLARLLNVSPYRLSRTFSQQVGVSLTRYRNRVRVSQAMDQLAQGEPSLANLAARLGFADQAHLTRTVREHLGHAPSTLRRLLAPVSQRG